MPVKDSDVSLWSETILAWFHGAISVTISLKPPREIPVYKFLDF
jgi:hypothetical protein